MLGRDIMAGMLMGVLAWLALLYLTAGVCCALVLTLASDLTGYRLLQRACDVARIGEAPWLARRSTGQLRALAFVVTVLMWPSLAGAIMRGSAR